MKTISASRRACLHRLRPLRPLGSLDVLQDKVGPAIGPMAAPRDPIDLGGPMCPMTQGGWGATETVITPRSTSIDAMREHEHRTGRHRGGEIGRAHV